MHNSNIVLSFCVMTYNHEEYIREALNSILSQKLDVEYEIVVGDDHSSDSTMDILKMFVSRYPNIIKVESNSKNEGIGNNFAKTFLRCSGKYVCYVDGDDFLLDDERTSRLLKFIQSNDEYIAVGSVNVSIDSETKNEIAYVPSDDCLERPFTLEDFLSGKLFPCTGTIFKNIGLTEEGKDKLLRIPFISRDIDDFTICVIMLMISDGFILSERTYAYRCIRKKGASNYNSKNKRITKLIQHINLLINLDKEYDNAIDLSKKIVFFTNELLKCCVKHFSFRTYANIYKRIPTKYRKVKKKSLFAVNVRFIFQKMFRRSKK